MTFLCQTYKSCGFPRPDWIFSSLIAMCSQLEAIQQKVGQNANRLPDMQKSEGTLCAVQSALAGLVVIVLLRTRFLPLVQSMLVGNSRVHYNKRSYPWEGAATKSPKLGTTETPTLEYLTETPKVETTLEPFATEALENELLTSTPTKYPVSAALSTSDISCSMLVSLYSGVLIS